MSHGSLAVTFLAILVVTAGSSTASPQWGEGGPVNCDTPGVTAPDCIGQWRGPYRLCISCDRVTTDPGFCASGCSEDCIEDELGHVVLIPSGDHAGKLLVWSRCHNRYDNPVYSSHVIDPGIPPSVVASPSFEPALWDEEEDEMLTEHHIGPFCAGHTWVLDDSGEPKLLALGGDDFVAPTMMGPIIGAKEAFLFDPDPASFGWSDSPADLYDPVWYPSLITVEDAANERYVPFAVGGTDKNVVFGCGNRYSKVWTLPSLGSSMWTVSEPSSTTPKYKWHQYPRTLWLQSGDVVAPGNAISCEFWDPGGDPMTWPAYAEGSPPPRWFYGDNPNQTLTFTTPTSMTHAYGTNPNNQPPNSVPVGGMHYNSAVLLHTLQPGWQWDEEDIEGQYDLDRVITVGGSYEGFSDSVAGLPIYSPGNQTALELQDPPHGEWKVKAQPFDGRVFSNLVILPDGKLFLVGGQDAYPVPGTVPEQIDYHTVPELFDPQGPSDAGEWKQMAGRLEFEQTGFAVFRGYHNMAILLADGTVALLGGVNDSGLGNTVRSSDTIEVFSPPYVFKTPKPVITGLSSSTMQYGTPFCFTVNRTVTRVCLIGVGSITHHFDYGQRYVELMFENNPSGCQGSENLRVLAPTSSMAPEGYYLLFVLNNRGPSKGKLIKLTW